MAWYHRILNVARSNRVSREIDRELAFHLAERADELQARGLGAEDALRQAQRSFGNVTTQRERTRAADIAEWVQSVAGDVQYALRALVRAPAFGVVAVVSLGLGIGANTTIFTLLDAVVLRPLPVVRPEELLQVSPDSSRDFGYFTNPLWEQVRDRQEVFSAVTAWGETSFNLANGGEAKRVRGAYVSGDYFTTFAVQPAIGRLFTRGDDRRGCPGSAVLGHRFWERAYGGARDVVGRTINLSGHSFEIVGVAPSDFRGPDVGREADVYVPLCSEALIAGEQSSLDRRSRWFLRVMARLKPGIQPAQASVRMAGIARAAYAETLPENYATDMKTDYLHRSLFVMPAQRGLSDMRTRYSQALYVLMAGVGLVLLIACGNVANLLLSRAEVRQHEFAIRQAIGAGRLRLVRQLLTESLILAVLGTVVGLLIAQWGTQVMVGLIEQDGVHNSVSLDLSINGRLLAFASAVAALTVFVFGVAPAWRATRVSAHASMKTQGRGVVEGHSRWAMGKVLVVAQVALSLVLVVGAVLFVGTFRKLSHVDAGFSPERVLVVDVDLRRAGVQPEAVSSLRTRTLERVRGIPGVMNAGSVDITPVSGSSWNDLVVADGFHPKSDEDATTWFNEVSDAYFSTMETRLLAGRDFDRTDLAGAPLVAIVNDAWARRIFGNASPVGRQFRVKMQDTTSASYTIVGVVENTKYRSLRDESEATAYLPASQRTPVNSTVSLVLRTAGEPLAIIPAVRQALREVNPAITLDFSPLSRVLADSLQRERMLAVLSALFGALAAALAMLGLYGVMAYAVARRRAELGVRIALGAGRQRVVRMVLGEVVRVVALGVAIGGVATVASTRLITSLLFAMEPTSPAVYFTSAALLGAIALAAGLVPAWRAASVDPIDALREQ